MISRSISEVLSVQNVKCLCISLFAINKDEQIHLKLKQDLPHFKYNTVLHYTVTTAAP